MITYVEAAALEPTAQERDAAINFVGMSRRLLFTQPRGLSLIFVDGFAAAHFRALGQ